MNMGKKIACQSLFFSQTRYFCGQNYRRHTFTSSVHFSSFHDPLLFALLSVLGYNTAAVDAHVASALSNVTVFSRMLTLPWRPPCIHLVRRKLLSWYNPARGAVLFLTAALLFVLGHVGRKSIHDDKHFRHKLKDSQSSVFIHSVISTEEMSLLLQMQAHQLQTAFSC